MQLKLKQLHFKCASLNTTLNAFGQRIASVEDGLNDLDKRLNCVELSQASLAKENRELRDKVTYLENYTRRQNIRIVGIPENTEGAKPTEFIAKLLLELFGEDNFQTPPSVDRAHRSSAPKPGEGNRPRPLIVKLHHFQTKERILRLAREKGKLTYNGTRIHIFPDFRPDINKRRAAFSESKQLLHAAQIKFAMYYPATLQFSHDKNSQLYQVENTNSLTYLPEATDHMLSPARRNNRTCLLTLFSSTKAEGTVVKSFIAL
uniref:L1 transposable element RRM domain-containing protein n=1 Tax=Fundulus heteroclitus TaxID=8078 RepID=A0A3Q2PUB8_FUNHE